MPTADITIIGGGILGISIAYQLAMRGTKNILVLEKESIAHASSGRGAGGIRQQFADELDIRFSQEGVRFYKPFTTEGEQGRDKPSTIEGEQGRDKPYPYYGTDAIVQAERPHFY